MAMADYRLCDKCSAKAFYDANLNYDFDRRDESGAPKLDNVGDMAVLCDECAKTFETKIVPKPAVAPVGSLTEDGGCDEKYCKNGRIILERGGHSLDLPCPKCAPGEGDR